MSINNVLIIDDEPDIRELLELTLTRMGLNATCVDSVSAAHISLKANHFDLCLTDMNLPDGTGLEIVEYIQSNYTELPVAVITAYGNMELAVQSLKAGAFDFVSKPIDLKVLRGLIEAALKVAGKQSTNSQELSGLRLLGNSMPMQKLRKTISKLARSQAPVYIHGESGSGKEVTARNLHRCSSRKLEPFLTLNCAAFNGELLESQLFGHVKGSFTGATETKKGFFEEAGSGTLPSPFAPVSGPSPSAPDPSLAAVTPGGRSPLPSCAEATHSTRSGWSLMCLRNQATRSVQIFDCSAGVGMMPALGSSMVTTGSPS